MKRKHPDWLRSFVELYSSIGEAPISMYFWTGVSTIAGALRRNVWIDQSIFQWVPNFYIILVAPPGIVSKSTTSATGMNLLRSVPGVKFGPDVCTWQALAQAFSVALEGVPMPDGNIHMMSALTIESSEFGNLLNPSDREMVDFLVTLWDCKRGAIKKITKSQGNDVIENPFINLIASTTPSWIEGSFPEYMIGGGFTSRCVFVYADQKRRFVAYPKLSTPSDFQRKLDDLVQDLVEIASLRGEMGMSKAATDWGEKWYEEHYKNRPANLTNDRFSGYLARKQTHIHKLAMILCAAEGNTMVLEPHHLETANIIMTALESDMPRVFERIGTSLQSRGATNLVNIVRTYGKIERKKLFTHMFRELSLNDFNAALTAAVEARYVRIEQEGDVMMVIALQ